MKERYWFRAKEKGIGWGLPIAWQGWAVLGLFIAGVIAARSWLLPAHLGLYLFVVGALAVALIFVCFAKGEPPHG